jgi:hypothetical protein
MLNEKVPLDLVIVMMQRALLTVVENEKKRRTKKKLSLKLPMYIYTPSLKKSWIRPW